MKHKFLILGGDLRSSRLAEMLAKDNHKVYVYGQENSDEVLDDKEIEKCNSLKTAIDKADIIVGPVPFSNNGESINAPFSESKIMIDDLFYKEVKF